jgi:hypothetical protein
MLKGDDKIINEETLREGIRYQETNPHEDLLKEVCKRADVGYGRIDYSLLGEELQVWEINTNPTLIPAGRIHPLSRPLVVRFTRAFSEAMTALDVEDPPGGRISIRVIEPQGESAREVRPRTRPRRPAFVARMPPRLKGLVVELVVRILRRPLLKVVDRRLASIRSGS